MPGLVSGHRKNLAPTNHTASIDWQGRGFIRDTTLLFPLFLLKGRDSSAPAVADMVRPAHRKRFGLLTRPLRHALRTRLQGGIPFQRHLASRIPEDDVFVKTARNKVVSAPALTMCFTFIVVYITSC